MSLKNRLAQDNNNAALTVNKISKPKSRGNQSRWILIPIDTIASMITSTVEAITKSKRLDKTAETGHSCRGKYILVIRFALLVRLPVANLIDPTKNTHGSDFTATDDISARFNGLPESMENAFLTTIPAATIIIGMKMAQKKPIIACLYLIFISRHVNVKRR